MPAISTRYLLLGSLLWASCSPDTPARQPAQAAAVPQSPLPVSAAPVADTLPTYTWESDACRYAGRYNPRRYTRAQLDGTWQVLSQTPLLHYRTLPAQPADIERLNLDSLEADYARLRTQYLRLAVVPQPAWQKLKRARLRELEAEYQASKIILNAFISSGASFTTAYAAGCERYTQGLAAQNDSLIRRDWQRLAEEHKKQSGIPESYMARFDEQYASADWLLYAKIDLLTYGWWNCVNTNMARPQPGEQLHQQFEQLFVGAVRTDCDEAD
ncbi:hypothetical protein [Hymenobacter elongatus]|uniref:Lipoprotein n=1 Tax=Hymenobacter elongatus TaxID=877208 RepID=A0A4Z0PN84_9BACT|nr:hypothetical protein [Hymenobacter elongatus]TGE18055.1 hypothetical protein E5J99_05830 [Hymenobacter elongatus]